jgi:PAS domain S-box-containing protein
MTENSSHKMRRSSKQVLRKRAEARLLANPPTDLNAHSPEEKERLIHELQVHALELDMQNEELQQIKIDLEASRGRYFELYDQAPVGYLSLSQQGDVLYANLTISLMLGLERINLVQKPFYKFILREDADIFYLFSKRLFATGDPQVCRVRMEKKNGVPFWARLEATVVTNQAGMMPICRMVVSNISEQKKTETKLEETEYKYRLLAENSPDIIYIIDLTTYKSAYMNRPTLLGYTLEELETSGSIMSRVHPEDLAKVQIHWHDISRGEDAGPVEYRLQLKDGSWEWVSSRERIIARDVNGKPTQVLVTLSLITQQKQVEKALRESEERFHGVMDNMQEGVSLIGYDWRYLYLNKTAEIQGGRPIEDLLGRTLMECWPGIEANDFFKLEQKVMQERVSACIDGPFLFPDGSEHWFTWYIHPAQEGLLIITVDITERKKAEMALEKAKAELEQRGLVEKT